MIANDLPKEFWMVYLRWKAELRKNLWTLKFLYVGGCKTSKNKSFELCFYTLQLYKMKTNNDNNFDFLDEINDQDLKNEKPKNKQDLWDYLNGFSFVSREEIAMAVCDFFMEEMGVLNPSYWELWEYDALADEYIKETNRKK